MPRSYATRPGAVNFFSAPRARRTRRRKWSFPSYPLPSRTALGIMRGAGSAGAGRHPYPQRPRGKFPPQGWNAPAVIAESRQRSRPTAATGSPLRHHSGLGDRRDGDGGPESRDIDSGSHDILPTGDMESRERPPEIAAILCNPPWGCQLFFGAASNHLRATARAIQRRPYFAVAMAWGRSSAKASRMAASGPGRECTSRSMAFRSAATACGALPVRIRLASSRKATSRR